ncbi:hypothetical protein E2562_002540 [Oryza meyeriana var. granulata]|uniref:ATP-dependent DNA helicase n=1 Tax=Oryza meyeriana var. granulata TaxID=110450 RepID=A0A6G1F2T7_9ORYZ|nr:hypothetical protein E2562_002540 [Oryza meyeriana var. granulata]
MKRLLPIKGASGASGSGHGKKAPQELENVLKQHFGYSGFRGKQLEAIEIHEDLDSGNPSLKLLYVTPELVATPGFKAKLAKLYNRGLLGLVAIDEAHCISTWGHDFRPSYRKLSSLRNHFPDIPILALTATAVPKVQKDVISSLCLRNPVILRASFNRPNIFYEVRYKDLLDDVYSDISNLLKSSGTICSIVYCLERAACDDLTMHLSQQGISSAAYHAGLNSKVRSSVLDDWLSSRTQVVVATVAFGMGIDRQDVRIVCHYNLPKSMEAFYQESGRAGRDQQPSRSVLYYGLDDRKKMEFILRNTNNKKSQLSSSSTELSEKALSDFSQIIDYCESSTCRRKMIIESFGEKGKKLVDKKSISQTLRDASQKRLLNVLGQAKLRLGNLPFDEEPSAAHLEVECFKKYEKVGKTFYNSQIAATVRWVSSSSFDQIQDRLHALTDKITDHGAAASSPSIVPVSSPASPDVVCKIPGEASSNEAKDTPLADNTDEFVEHSDEFAKTAVSSKNMELPKIPSFRDFISQKGRGRATSSSKAEIQPSGVRRKARIEKQGMPGPSKKMKS